MQLLGDQALLTRRAVVGQNIRLVADFAHLVFQHQQVFAARADDRDHLVPRALQFTRRGISHRRPDTPADDDCGAKILDLTRLTQGPHDVEDRIAHLEHIQQHGRFADALHHDGDRPGFRIGVGKGQGNALAGVVQTDNDELAGTLFFGDPRRLDFEEFYASRNLASSDNGEHPESSTIDSGDERPKGLWHTSHGPGHCAQTGENRDIRQKIRG